MRAEPVAVRAAFSLPARVLTEVRSCGTIAYSAVRELVGGSPGLVFAAGMQINADGSPRAYHPNGCGLDHLANAGCPGNWWGIATKNGKPCIQGRDHPAPGYYVSTTKLEDRSKKEDDPARYVDSERINFIVLPRGMKGGAKMGDFAVVIRRETGHYEYAICGDQGPPGKIGEGSIALAQALGINANPRNGGVGDGIVYVIFPGTQRGWPLTQRSIDLECARLFAAWGGLPQAEAALA